MIYACPRCGHDIIAATQQNFDTLPVDKRKRRFFDPTCVPDGRWVIIASKITEDGYTHTVIYYREKRQQDDKNKLRNEHKCKGKP
jgi:hypothetical protein